jgi:hypothetical protein
MMKEVVRFVMGQTGCEAVGIRLRDGDDFPYFEAKGFPDNFILRRTACAAEIWGDSF